MFLIVYDAKIREKTITTKRKTIFFIGKSPFDARRKGRTEKNWPLKTLNFNNSLFFLLHSTFFNVSLSLKLYFKTNTTKKKNENSL